MSEAGSGARSLALILLCTVSQGCVYLNAFYNAKRTFGEAEDARWAGRDSLLQESYADVVDKATRAYRADPEGKWADDALFLAGRAHLRRGDLQEARTALASAVSLTSDTLLDAEARLYQGAVEVADGELERGLQILNDALGDLSDRRTKGEGYLWRARALLQLGRIEAGWADLDLAAETDDRYAIPADLERLIWGVRYDDVARASRGVQALIGRSGARRFGDSVSFLIDRAADEWGPAVAVGLMARAEEAPWSRVARDRLLMHRARLAHAAGDTAQAVADALRVGGGVGPFADSARVTVAGWRLASANQLGQLAEVRALLLPAVGSSRARDMLNAIRRVELLVDHALDGEWVAFFAAAERARDVLGANRIAGGLFRAYANSDRESAWVGKALLAALPLAEDPTELTHLEDRLDALPENEYARYARLGVEDGSLASLEAELQRVLDELLAQVEAELVQRRLFVADPTQPDTLGAPAG